MRERKDGAGWIWLCALSLALILLLMLAVGGLVLVNSLDALWPARMEQVALADGSAFLGVELRREKGPEGERLQYKVANRDLNNGADFQWIEAAKIAKVAVPADAMLVKRQTDGDFYGTFKGLILGGREEASSDPARLRRAVDENRSRREKEVSPLADKVDRLGLEWQDIRLALLRADYDAGRAEATEARQAAEKRRAALAAREETVKRESERVLGELNAAKAALVKDAAWFETGDGKRVSLPLPDIVDAWSPNALSFPGKVWRLIRNARAFLFEAPREANTDGGLFPALFGTALLVLIMAVSAFPLGVAAGVYLREYARDGLASRLARVAVNNLAGVPSIVYGIFGLGFFVYGLGGGIDRLLYPERAAAGISVFGSGGILWSSLTLGLLTLPVVIVATEESLASVPGEMRQGSLALGATKYQTLRLVLMPMAAPGIMTGFILAMARAAGEVAPLMLTGVVKMAPALAMDGNWPFLHLERKFMHLGFHIYDMGFQSPNVEASKPLVYLTALVLLVLVFALNAAAFRLRRKMRERYSMKGF